MGSQRSPADKHALSSSMCSYEGADTQAKPLHKGARGETEGAGQAQGSCFDVILMPSAAPPLPTTPHAAHSRCNDENDARHDKHHIVHHLAGRHVLALEHGVRVGKQRSRCKQGILRSASQPGEHAAGMLWWRLGYVSCEQLITDAVHVLALHNRCTTTANVVQHSTQVKVT